MTEPPIVPGPAQPPPYQPSTVPVPPQQYQPPRPAKKATSPAIVIGIGVAVFLIFVLLLVVNFATNDRRDWPRQQDAPANLDVRMETCGNTDGLNAPAPRSG